MRPIYKKQKESDEPKNPFQIWMYGQGYVKNTIWYKDGKVLSGRELVDKKKEFDMMIANN